MSDLSSINELLRQAAARLKSGDTTGAKAILKEVLSKDSKNADAWFLISRTTADRGQRVQALERALSIKPDHAHALRDIEKLKSESISALPNALPSTSSPALPASRSPRTGLLIGIGLILITLIAAGVVIMGGTNRGGQTPTFVATNAVAANNPTALPTTVLPTTGSSTQVAIVEVSATSTTEPTSVPTIESNTPIPTTNTSTNDTSSVLPDEAVRRFFTAAQNGDSDAFLAGLTDGIRARIKSMYSDPIKGFTRYFDDIQQITNLTISITKQTETTASVALQFHGFVKGIDADFCQEYTLDNFSTKWGINAITAPLDCRRVGPDGTVNVFFANVLARHDTKDMLSDQMRGQIVGTSGNVTSYLLLMYPELREIKDFSTSNVSSDDNTAIVILQVHTTIKNVEGDYCQNFSLRKADNLWIITGFGKPELCQSR